MPGTAGHPLNMFNPRLWSPIFASIVVVNDEIQCGEILEAGIFI